RVLVHLVPYEGEQDAGGRAVTLLLPTGAVRLASCGVACRGGLARLGTLPRLAVRVSGRDGGVARFVVPNLYSPNGEALLAQAHRVMFALHSARTDEVLGPADPPLRVTYLNQA